MFIGEEDEPVIDVAVARGATGARHFRRMLLRLLKRYREADIVTGHYIRGFDLPLLNSGLIRAGLPILEDKLIQDTKLDLVKRSGISASQENLGALFELEHPKVPSNEPLWISAVEGFPDGVEWMKSRVGGDVLQHIEMREVMLQRGILGPPRRWTGRSAGTGMYQP